MAAQKPVASVSAYLDAVQAPVNRLGLVSVPATPWYLGQPDTKGSLLPALYTLAAKTDVTAIKVEHEREILRDYRQTSAEFVPTKLTPDADILTAAQMNGLPTRILEWSSNPLFALFIAVENMSAADAARVWVFNPWRFNNLAADLDYVPIVDHLAFASYVVALDDPNASLYPEAARPMAFRPARTNRNYNLQSVYWTVHGKETAPLTELTFFMKRASEYYTAIHIEAAAKVSIMRELHDLGITRIAFYPALTSLTRTLAYRYSKAYIGV